MKFCYTLFQRLLDILFPDSCAACGRAGLLFCSVCQARLRAYPGEPPPDGLDGFTVAWIYDDTLQRAIARLKYQKMRRMAQPLGDLLAERLAHMPQPADALMAVPLHADRLRERGFNQSVELALRISRRSGLPLVSGLERGRDTGHQASLNRRDRQVNVLGAFRWGLATPPPKRVLLVDDVLTTGATLRACAEALRAAGAIEIRAVALARSLAPSQRAGLEKRGVLQ